MTLNEYQQKALETAVYPQNYKIVYPALGMNGEAGEVADKVKKVIRDSDGEFTDEKKREIAKEIGDVLSFLLEAVIDKKTENEKEKLLEYVKQNFPS